MTTEETADLVRRALSGDPAATARLVEVLTPVIQARVAHILLANQHRLAAGRDVRQEVEYLCREVFLALFARDAHILRAWQPERGLSLESFVLSFLTSGKAP